MVISTEFNNKFSTSHDYESIDFLVIKIAESRFEWFHNMDVINTLIDIATLRNIENVIALDNFIVNHLY